MPELLTRALRVDDLYFDAVSTVALPTWSTGRVVLVGDAAASVSLFGDGSSLAIAGARTLATALAEGDHVTHSAGTNPSTDAAPMPLGAAQVSWRPC